MKKKTIAVSMLAAAASTLSATAAIHAVEVVQYTPGTGVGTYTDPSKALGPSSGTLEFGIFTPFNSPFSNNDLARIGTGGSLTLRLENFVLIDRTPGTFELGVWENVGLVDTAFPNGSTGPTTFEFGSDSARVEVSPDNVNWYSLNGGDRILFGMPGNYFANATNSDTAPASPVLADFGKPFTGPLSSFDNKNLSQILTTLDGSAGGTWLNLDSVPLEITQIGWVRFSDPQAGPGSMSGDHTFELDTIAINRSLVGAPTPEPGTAALLLGAFALCGSLRQRRR